MASAACLVKAGVELTWLPSHTLPAHSGGPAHPSIKLGLAAVAATDVADAGAVAAGIGVAGAAVAIAIAIAIDVAVAVALVVVAALVVITPQQAAHSRCCKQEGEQGAARCSVHVAGRSVGHCTNGMHHQTPFCRPTSPAYLCRPPHRSPRRPQPDTGYRAAGRQLPQPRSRCGSLGHGPGLQTRQRRAEAAVRWVAKRGSRLYSWCAAGQTASK